MSFALFTGVKMKLGELIKDLTFSGNFNPELEITGISYNSRDVKSGDLFIAISGEKYDGKDFIPEAKRKGAVAFVSDSALPIENLVLVDDTREALALISKEFYGRPDEKMSIVGVTGTNGKSTTTHIIASIFNAASIKSAVVGTLGCVYEGQCERLRHTTPESKELYALLAKLMSKGVRFVAMEASSHGLFLKRVYGIKWAGAVFTNLTQDHLDFHGSMEEYFEAKKILFRSISSDVPAVVNIDDPYGKILSDEFKTKKASILNADADYRVEPICFRLDGSRMKFLSSDGEIELETRLIGRFNAYNILLGAAISHLLGRTLEEIKRGVRQVAPVKGRIEQVPGKQPFYVFIDYAHTPDALEMIITSVRELNPSRIILVFGCGGDRDRTKRPKMGAIGAKYADILIITSDNPRSE
ncbi:MAG: UDP-N-acetylmuramoyl-L-alanyl-D-glutamate--2,6-diaminopimelate ligase, partial [bacterium]